MHRAALLLAARALAVAAGGVPDALTVALPGADASFRINPNQPRNGCLNTGVCVVQSPLSGIYLLTAHTGTGGLPVWKKVGGNWWLYPSGGGFWMIHDVQAKDKGFKDSYGFAESAKPHNGAMPQEIDAWEYAVSDDRWQRDGAGVVVVTKDLNVSNLLATDPALVNEYQVARRMGNRISGLQQKIEQEEQLGLEQKRSLEQKIRQEEQRISAISGVEQTVVQKVVWLEQKIKQKEQRISGLEETVGQKVVWLWVLLSLLAAASVIIGVLLDLHLGLNLVSRCCSWVRRGANVDRRDGVPCYGGEAGGHGDYGSLGLYDSDVSSSSGDPKDNCRLLLRTSSDTPEHTSTSPSDEAEEAMLYESFIRQGEQVPNDEAPQVRGIVSIGELALNLDQVTLGMMKVCERNGCAAQPTKAWLQPPGGRWAKVVLIFLMDQELSREGAKSLAKKFKTYAHVKTSDHIYIMGPAEVRKEADEALGTATGL